MPTAQDENALRAELCDIAHRTHAAGFVGGSDGNVSARLADDRFLISASATCLGTLAPDDLVVIDADGAVIHGARRASSERWMHLAAYAQRPDVSAIVHAHPPHVVAMTIADLPMPDDVLPEIIIAFGRAPLAPYATPGTKDGASVVSELVQQHDAIILDRHGALTLGSSIHAALMKLEQLEHAARILTIATQLGNLRRLPADEIHRLHELRAAYHGNSPTSG
ncbi:MAG TPA: class II aldolase/adducin family protein [Phycisphaerae bacterium]|nr:class II aldolase/adducin family protein [Phycisphaerae bacterium]HRW51384.1 class II aldolase/adducin family protein [Phycisphaerae bacterium]